MNRLPGWEPDSWGYHGDDGNAFSSHGPGKNYGPQFAFNDVIGCGVNFHNSTAFFTKNGVHLGIEYFQDIVNRGLMELLIARDCIPRIEPYQALSRSRNEKAGRAG